MTIELNQRPLVTIGITSYNAADTLPRAIQSALTQSWRPVEIVAVDDGSTDASLEILQKFARDCPLLRIFSNGINQGASTARNRILAEARGEFVAFFDDDDESHPSRFEKQVNRICDYEQRFAGGAPVICHTARQLIYPNGSEQYAPTMGQAEECPAPSGIKVAQRILMGTPLKDGYGGCPTSSQMARLATYRLVGGFDPQFRRSDDTEFNIRLALAGGHFVGIREPLVRQFMTSAAEKSLAEEGRYFAALMQKHRAIMDAEGQYEFCMEWLAAKYLWLEKKYGDFLLKAAKLAFNNPVRTGFRLRVSVRHLPLNLAFSKFHKKMSSGKSL